MLLISICIDLGQYGLFASLFLDRVPLRGHEEEFHGFSDPLVPVFEVSFEILPPEFPGGSEFWTEYLLVDGGEFWPLIVKPMGV